MISITIPSSVISIGNYAFAGCNQLLVQEEDGISYLDDWVVNCDSSVIFAKFRKNTKGIVGGAFSGCSSLTSIIISSSMTSIGTGTGEFSSCSNLTSILVENGNKVFHAAGNCLIETASKTLLAGCKNSVIPTDGSVTSRRSWHFKIVAN